MDGKADAESYYLICQRSDSGRSSWGLDTNSDSRSGATLTLTMLSHKRSGAMWANLGGHKSPVFREELQSEDLKITWK